MNEDAVKTDAVNSIVGAIKSMSDAAMKNDEALLDVMRAIIKKVTELEARIIELELINFAHSSSKVKN